MTVMNHLSLFSGYEGFGLGLKLAGIPIRTVGYVEIDEYCQRLLQARIRDGYLDWAPIIRDIRSADFRPMAGLVDIVTAGFPCQPHSFAGKRKGAADERNLWPDTLRVIREVGPEYALLENVYGLTHQSRGKAAYAWQVVGDLASIGYDCIWHHVPAAAVGAPHLRWRWWCLAYATSLRLEEQKLQQGLHAGESPIPLADAEGQPRALWTAAGERPGRLAGGGFDVPDSNGGRAHPEPECQPQCGGAANPGGDGKVWTLADSESQGLETISAAWGGRAGVAGRSWWAVEPDVGRVANGVASRMDRLRACGNGIVPAVVAKFLLGDQVADRWPG